MDGEMMMLLCIVVEEISDEKCRMVSHILSILICSVPRRLSCDDGDADEEVDDDVIAA
jgi:hypothetical protein